MQQVKKNVFFFKNTTRTFGENRHLKSSEGDLFPTLVNTFSESPCEVFRNGKIGGHSRHKYHILCKNGQNGGIPAPKATFFRGAVGFIANDQQILTKFRNYGISKMRWPKVGTLGHFMGNWPKWGRRRPKNRGFFVARLASKPTHKIYCRNSEITEFQRCVGPR